MIKMVLNSHYYIIVFKGLGLYALSISMTGIMSLSLRILLFLDSVPIMFKILRALNSYASVNDLNRLQMPWMIS